MTCFQCKHTKYGYDLPPLKTGWLRSSQCIHRDALYCIAVPSGRRKIVNDNPKWCPLKTSDDK